MYNRCDEVHNILNTSSTYIPTLTLAILSIISQTNYGQPFYSKCTCDQYYFYRTAFAVYGNSTNNLFSRFTCLGDAIPFVEKCNNRSSANFEGVIPRFCKIDISELGDVPVYVDSSPCEPDPSTIPTVQTTTTTKTTTTTTTTTTTKLTTTKTTTPPRIEIIANETEKELEKIPVLDNSTAINFTEIINQAHNDQNTIDNPTITEDTQKKFQNIIREVERLIQSVNTTLNISSETVAVFSSIKSNLINRLTQFILSNLSIIHSTEPDYLNSKASISINQASINNLLPNDVLRLFFLPSSFFDYAQTDPYKTIVSPIVGAYLSDERNLSVNMSFTDDDINRPSGKYSCEFWQDDRWIDTGCIYSKDFDTDRHYCNCNQLKTSGLIFTPYGILRETFIPSVITACLSIIGLGISIILSVYQQTKPKSILAPRHLPIVNIFSLLSTLILFILLTILLITNRQLLIPQSTTTSPCQSSGIRNLILATYFFVILTFTTKTLLAICYFSTIFIHFTLIRSNDRPGKWFFAILFLIIMIALIPTIVISSLVHRSPDVIIQYTNICWFHRSYLITFITIPVSILIGINIIIVVLISIQLVRIIFCSSAEQAKEKRLMSATCIWIASCILLGIVWVVGPLLGLFVDETDQSTSVIEQRMQWVFALLIGLEGVWILIVNILFYLRQQPEKQGRWASSPTSKRIWLRIDNFARVSVDTMNDEE